MRVLVVDDHAASRALLQAVLGGAGYEVVLANDADTAVRAFGEHRPDLVITDVFMRGGDGVQLIREIRRQSPNVKVIVVSAGWRVPRLELGPQVAEDDVLRDALAAGANAALPKPLDTTLVLDTAANLLGRQR
jgi:CheY-like chemotaxis protein